MFSKTLKRIIKLNNFLKFQRRGRGHQEKIQGIYGYFMDLSHTKVSNASVMFVRTM